MKYLLTFLFSCLVFISSAQSLYPESWTLPDGRIVTRSLCRVYTTNPPQYEYCNDTTEPGMKGDGTKPFDSLRLGDGPYPFSEDSIFVQHGGDLRRPGAGALILNRGRNKYQHFCLFEDKRLTFNNNETNHLLFLGPQDSCRPIRRR
jgi:hypothetical protein